MPEPARSTVDSAEPPERMAGPYAFSGDERPIDSTLPQNRPIGSDSHLQTGSTGLPPPLEWYKYLMLMEVLEKRDDKRGGPGRVSWEEFESLMKGPRAEELRFLGSWIEMAIF